MHPSCAENWCKCNQMQSMQGGVRVQATATTNPMHPQPGKAQHQPVPSQAVARCTATRWMLQIWRLRYYFLFQFPSRLLFFFDIFRKLCLTQVFRRDIDSLRGRKRSHLHTVVDPGPKLLSKPPFLGNLPCTPRATGQNNIQDSA